MATGTIQLASIRELNYRRGVEIPADADLDTYDAAGLFYCPSGTRAGSLSNCPVSTNFRLEVYLCGSADSDAKYRMQVIRTTLSDSLIYIRNQFNNTWNSWQRVATDKDLAGYVHFDSPLSSSGSINMTRFSITNSSGSAPSYTLNVPGGYTHGVLFSSGGASGVEGMTYFRTDGNGNATVSNPTGMSSISFDTSVANKVTITNSSGYWAYMLYIHY